MRVMFHPNKIGFAPSPAAHISGTPVFTSVILPEFNEQQARVHKHRRGMKLSYHRRIQKKWRKRFGFTRNPYILQTTDGFFMHPNTLKWVKDNIVTVVSVHGDEWDRPPIPPKTELKFNTRFDAPLRSPRSIVCIPGA